MTRRARLLTLTTLTIMMGAAFAGVPSRITKRGWRPMVKLAGDGDTDLAVTRLRSGVATVGIVLNGLDIDEPTQGFIDEVRGSLSSFDLEEFYETLPEKDGRWRKLRVYGKCQGKAFPVRQAPKTLRCKIGPKAALGQNAGDLAIEVRARPSGEDYLMRGEVGLGIGSVGWDGIVGMLEESARLVASGDPKAPGGRTAMSNRAGTKTRLTILKTHPALRPEDIEVVGVLWESFPALGKLLNEIARVEDMLVYDVKGKGQYTQLRLQGRLQADLLEANYPSLSEFFTGLGRLMHVQVNWVDSRGRQLGRLSFETESLRLRMSCFVSDGRLLPVSNGQVLFNEPVTQASLSASRCLVDFKSTMNGVVAQIHGLEIDWAYASKGSNADLTAQITKVPKVSVSGKAFGILPTWAIDVIIPGNIDELTTEFLETAVKGNEGRGIEIALKARQAEAGGAGTVSAALGLEVLDSTLVSIAMSIASQKLLPDPDVRGDIHKLLLKIHGAFAKDLERFNRVQAGK